MSSQWRTLELTKFATIVTSKRQEVSLVARDVPNSSGSRYVLTASAQTKSLKLKMGVFMLFNIEIKKTKIQSLPIDLQINLMNIQKGYYSINEMNQSVSASFFVMKQKNNFIIKLTTYCSMVSSYQTDNLSDQTIQNVQR